MALHLQVQQIRPLMFAVARLFTPNETEKAFRLFVSWTVRFLIYGGRGGLLDTQYSLRAKDVGLKHVKSARALRDAMKDVVPTDAQFEEAFATARVSRSHLARYYLRVLDKTMAAEPHPEYVANEDVEDVNLEHVLPLNPGVDWKVDEDTAQAAQRMLGNMVLLASDKNTDIGNSAFNVKRTAYDESGFLITKQVAKFDKWTMQSIRERQAMMAKTAVKAWSLKF
jgi:hypothetical protein